MASLSCAAAGQQPPPTQRRHKQPATQATCHTSNTWGAVAIDHHACVADLQHTHDDDDTDCRGAGHQKIGIYNGFPVFRSADRQNCGLTRQNSSLPHRSYKKGFKNQAFPVLIKLRLHEYKGCPVTRHSRRRAKNNCYRISVILTFAQGGLVGKIAAAHSVCEEARPARGWVSFNWN